MRTGNHLRTILFALTLGGVTAAPALGQECYLARGDMAAAKERTSPLMETVITLGGQEAKVCYGSPGVNSRTIFGELEAFGQPWRMGANEATAVHFPFAAEIGGIEVEPGSYSLYAIPGEEEWEIVVNGSFERWGIPINEGVMAENVGSFTRPAEATEELVERLIFRWDSHGEDMGHLVMEWENTRIEIPIRKGGM